MKLSKWAFALAIAVLIWPGAAVFAQIGSGLAPQSRAVGQPNTYNYGDYYANQPTESAPAVEPAVEEYFEEEAEEDAGPWRLVPQDNRFGISARGYLAQSFTWNPSNPVDRFNGPVTWTDRSNEYQLNEFYGTVERVTNTENSVFDVGFRADLLYGTNARFCTAAGIEDHWNHGRSFYGLAMPNAYVDVAMNDYKLRMGHFTSPVGYFAVGTANNFFNTLPYTFQYGEPFTHTGAVLALPKINDRLSLSGGIIQGWDNAGTEFNSHAGYLGTLNWAREEVGDSISFVQVYSLEPSLRGPGFPFKPDFTPRYLQTFVYSRPLRAISEDLTWVFQTDFGTQSNALADGTSAQWYGINQYLIWNQTDTLSWGLGFEWFRDDDGFRVGGFLPNFATIPAGGAPLDPRGLATTRFPYIGNFYQLTFGPRWAPNQNVIIRPNLRWDSFDGTSPLTGPGGAPNRPFDDGTKNWQILANIDVILQF